MKPFSVSCVLGDSGCTLDEAEEGGDSDVQRKEDYLSDFISLKYFPPRFCKMRVYHLFSKDFPPNATSFSKLSLIALCS